MNKCSPNAFSHSASYIRTVAPSGFASATPIRSQAARPAEWSHSAGRRRSGFRQMSLERSFQFSWYRMLLALTPISYHISPVRRNPVNCQMIVTEMYAFFMRIVSKPRRPARRAGPTIFTARRDASPYQVKRHECRFPEGHATGGTPVVPVGGCCSWLRAEDPTTFLGRTFVMEAKLSLECIKTAFNTVRTYTKLFR